MPRLEAGSSGIARYSRSAAGCRLDLDCDRIETTLHPFDRPRHSRGYGSGGFPGPNEYSTSVAGRARTLWSSELIRDRVARHQRRNQFIPNPPNKLLINPRRGVGCVAVEWEALAGAAGWIGSESKSEPTLAERDTSMSSMASNGTSSPRATASSAPSPEERAAESCSGWVAGAVSSGASPPRFGAAVRACGLRREGTAAP